MPLLTLFSLVLLVVAPSLPPPPLLWPKSSPSSLSSSSSSSSLSSRTSTRSDSSLLDSMDHKDHSDVEGSFIVVPNDTPSSPSSSDLGLSHNSDAASTLSVSTVDESAGKGSVSPLEQASLLQQELRSVLTPGKTFENWARTFRCVPEQYYTPSTEEEVIKVRLRISQREKGFFLRSTATLEFFSRHLRQKKLKSPLVPV